VNRSLDKSEASALIGVPKLTDLTADAAKDALNQKQLVPNPRNVFRSGNPGIVVGQDPPPGQKVEKGTPVKFDVSTDHVVPNVKDKPVEIAKSAVAREGMTLALGGDQDGPADKQGFVAWQDPEPGEPAPDGVVTIGVYRTADLKLLNYQDLDEISVSNQLVNSGLKVDPRQEGSDKPKGTILQQFPPPGTVVKKGDTVTLIVSSGHPPDASTTAFDPTATSATTP
jgi:serine/threonine-protein kinase